MARAPGSQGESTGGAKRPRDLARERKMAASIRGWRSGGTKTAAAAAASTSRRSVGRWLRTDPEYAAAAAAAIDEHIAESAQVTHGAAYQHVLDALSRKPLPKAEGYTTGPDGKRRPWVVRERVALNPAIAKLILVRHDPRYSGAHKELMEELAETTAEFFERKAREAAAAEARGERPPEGQSDAEQAALRAEAHANVVRLREESGKA